KSLIWGLGLVFIVSFLMTFSATSSVFAQEDTVTIGLNVPLSGSYQDQGEDELRSYKLAIDEVNAKGGILGKKVVYVVKDTQTNATVAGDNARELYTTNNAVMVTGGSSSAVAIAQGNVAGELKKIFMVGLSHSNATTGFEDNPKTGESYQAVNRYMFRWYNNGHQSAKAMASTLLEKFGKGAKYFYITADYTWGWSVEKSVKTVLENAGCTTVGSLLVPLGEKSFVPHLLKAKMAKPDVLVVVEFGKDMINCLKQANSMGLNKEMRVTVPLMELYMAKGAGAENMQGVIASEIWVWQLADKYPGSKEYVDKFKARYDRYPGSAAASAWVAIKLYAQAVEKAGTFKAEEVAKALEGMRFTILKDEERINDFDHQAVTSCVILEGKAPTEMANEWDFFKIIGIVPGEKIAQTKEENPVVWKEKF
ncbi:MAG: substrate-binding protein, partial [Candidatus Omnitrophota bacterium]